MLRKRKKRVAAPKRANAQDAPNKKLISSDKRGELSLILNAYYQDIKPYRAWCSSSSIATAPAR